MRMNKVDVNVEGVPLPGWSGRMCEYAVKVINEIGHEDWVLSVLLCDDKTITELNAQYRNKPEATDILSFSLGVEDEDEEGTYYLPGDIVISLETLRENAQYFQISEDEELRRLIIHGILHLDGMEHETNDKTEPMLVLQEEILNRLGSEHIITPDGGIKQ